MDSKPQIKKQGCLFSFVIDIITVMWIVAASLLIRSTVANFYVLGNIENISKKEMTIEHIDSLVNSSKGKSWTTYTLEGYLDENPRKPISAVFSSDRVSVKQKNSILISEKVDVWLMPIRKNMNKAKGNLVYVYPKIEDLVNHILISLFLIFFIPLALLIRFVYYHGRSIWDGITEPFKN